MIPRILVPVKLNPVSKDDAPAKPRRLTTLLDERTVIPSGSSDAPPLNGKSTIPAHFPLEVLVAHTLIPRGMDVKPLGDFAPPSEYDAPFEILKSRVVVPAFVEPVTAAEAKEIEKRPEVTPQLREMVDPDIYLTGEANLLVEPEKKRDPKWDLITRIASVAVHIFLIIFLISIPKIFPTRTPTQEEIRDASELLGKVYIPPGQIPKSPPAEPKVHITPKVLNKVAPPRPEEHAPALPPEPAPKEQPREDLPEAPTAHTSPTPPPQTAQEQPPPEEPPVRPLFRQPSKPLNLGIPSADPSRTIQQGIQQGEQHPSGGSIYTGGGFPRGAGANGGPGMSSGVQMLTPTEGVDFNSYLQRLLATLKRNWYAVMPESALMGDKGVVFTTFQVNRDGSVPYPDPTLERASGREPLDSAAMSAIRASSPFEPLPSQFKGPFIRLRIIFIYNIPPDQINLQ